MIKTAREFARRASYFAVFATAICLLVLASTPGHALTFVETTDLSDNFNTPTPIGTLSLGSNTISGVLTPASLVSDTSDNFSVTIPIGLELTSLELSVSGTPPTGFVGVSLRTNPNIAFQHIFSLPGSTGDLLTSALAGSQTFGIDVGCNVGVDCTNGSVDWTLTAGLVQVPVSTPLPAALPLFASDLGALGLFGWRRKRKAHGLQLSTP